MHRLRKDLGDDGAVLVKSGELSLNRRYFWLDTWAFEQASDRAFALASAARTPEQAQGLVGVTRAALNYCRGTLLADDAQSAWTVAPRERFRSQLLRLLSTVGAILEKQGLVEDLINIYRQALESDSLNEALYRSDAFVGECETAAQKRGLPVLSRRLQAEQQSDPSVATQELYRSLFAARPVTALWRLRPACKRSESTRC